MDSQAAQNCSKFSGLNILTDPTNAGDKSSENESVKANIENDLNRFRDNWRQEISQKSQLTTKNKSRKNFNANNLATLTKENLSFKATQCEQDKEKEATKLFQKGIDLEKSGKLYDAVACYRRATYLVPDIEKKIYASENSKNIEFHTNQKAIQDEEKVKEDCDNENLLIKLASLNLSNGFPICERQNQSNSTHISQLPNEIILYILRWVVAEHLDFLSLSRFAAVCKCFYILSKDQEIWRLACLKIWSILGIDQSIKDDYNWDWRRMYIEKPKANVNGAYISKATYVRQGDSSFQDINYRPVYLIEHYRYLRFFPEGIVLMLHSPDEPSKSLQKLRNYHSSHSTCLKGHYRIQGSSILAILKKVSVNNEKILYGRRNQTIQTITEREYKIELRISDFKGSRNRQLFWSNYTVTFRRPNGEEMTTTYDLSLTKFPPFWFSRVKSYTASSSALLT